ncbi:MAG: ATP-binding protein [Nanoarchaeota archaeon]
MEKELLRTTLIEQNENNSNIQDTIPRDLKDRVEKSATHSVAVISGLRRSGKSTLLQQIRAEQKGVYVNFDDDRFVNFTVEDFHKLHELALEIMEEAKTFFFDEIQNITGWERFVRRLHESNNTVYVTGSNATMLSKEMGTHLTGRHMSHSLYPFSFNEFLKYKQIKHDLKKPTTMMNATLKKAFNEFLKQGGIPKYLKENDKEYLRTIYKDILYRDIITRYNIKNEQALKETIFYLVSNIGKEISYNKLRQLVGLTSATTVREYIEYAQNTYLLFQVPRFEYSLKKQTYAHKKIYAVDQAIASIIGFRPTEDKGRILENTVFIELQRRGKETYYHKEKHECDFVIREGYRITQAIQVCHHLNDENKDREIKGLKEAMDEHKLKTGLLLTYDEEDEVKIGTKKIIIKPVWKWLLAKSEELENEALVN